MSKGSTRLQLRPLSARLNGSDGWREPWHSGAQLTQVPQPRGRVTEVGSGDGADRANGFMPGACGTPAAARPVLLRLRGDARR